jgi:hypothetical protein
MTREVAVSLGRYRQGLARPDHGQNGARVLNHHITVEVPAAGVTDAQRIGLCYSRCTFHMLDSCHERVVAVLA